MTTNDIDLASPRNDPSEDKPQPTFTWSQAKQSGLTTHKIFTLTAPLWLITVDYHGQACTPRDQWEPPELVGNVLGTRYNNEVAEELELTCSDDLDPQIEEIEDRSNKIDTTVQTVAERDPKLTSSETGVVYTENGAVTRVEHNTAKINADGKRGRSHHKRLARWFRLLGKIMPYGEALGMIVLLSFWLNVEWTRPWEDPLTWTLSVVVVLTTLLFTPRMVERAGSEGWNKRREAAAEGQSEAKQTATRKLLINGGIAAVVSVVIVAGLIERALAIIDDSVPESMLVLIIALCIIAGLAMPAIAFLAVAWDGSSLSRENDDLIEQLEEGRAEDQELRTEARSLNIACEQDELHINTEVAPAILRIAYEAVEEMRRAYGWLRVQIGGVPSAQPARPIEDLNSDEVRRSIPAGIPGAEPIRLDPLVTRGLRIQELQRRRAEAMARLHALPPHPWSGDQHAF